jgi:hypothetical protein
MTPDEEEDVPPSEEAPPEEPVKRKRKVRSMDDDEGPIDRLIRALERETNE